MKKDVVMKVEQSLYDQELASRGKRRTRVMEAVFNEESGTWSTIWREKIVPIETAKKARLHTEDVAPGPKRVFKPIRSGTNLEKVVNLLKDRPVVVTREDKDKALQEIVTLLGVSSNNASVYLSKAIRVVARQ